MGVARLVLVGMLMLSAPCLAFTWGDDCDHTAEREAVVDAKGATAVRIDVGAGFLHVRGKEGLSEVRATGNACHERESKLDEVELVGRRSGDKVVIETRMPSDGNCRIDVTIEVPSDLLVTLDDSSGELSLSNVAGADIEDSSGEIEVSDIAGDLTIDDSSGEIEVRNVTGSIRLNDSSGEIDVAKVDGDVLIENDSSGDIRVSDVGGNLRIREDSSGSIRAVRITGDFIVDRDGSGGIEYREIGGKVDIPD